MVAVDITTKFWRIMDRLRGDSGFSLPEFGLQLAVLIYLRWADFQEAECGAVAAFEDTEYLPILPPSLHWRTWHAYEPAELAETLCHRLPRVLADLVNTRNNPLATHLHRLAEPLEHFREWPPDSLAAVVHWLADQPFETPADRRQLLELFEQVVIRSFKDSRNVSGEYFEPAWVAELVAALGRPAAGERIYDPCFGQGAFLAAVCDYVQTNSETRFRRSGTPALSVSGMDIDVRAFVMGMTRLALAGVDSPQLELGNSLERNPSGSPDAEGYDLIVANPPWGLRLADHGLDHYPIKSNDASCLFIQHVLAQLRPDGRAVIVVPQSILFRGGADQKLRELLIRQHGIETVIGLPAGAFLPYSGIACGIIVLRRKGPTRQIHMADAERLFLETKKGEPPTSEQIKNFAKLVQSDHTTDDAWFASVDEIAKADWDLSPRRRNQSGLEALLHHLQQSAPVVRLSESCDIFTGRYVKNTDLLNTQRGESMSISGPETIPYIRICDIRNGVAGKGTKWLVPEVEPDNDSRCLLRSGDVLLSKSGTIGKAAIVRNGAVGAVPSQGLLILRPKDERLDPHFLTAYLASAECQAWLQARARGAVIAHLSNKQLAELPVPLPPLHIQLRIAEMHREHGVDALTVLTRLLIEGEHDPVIDWLDKAWQYLKTEQTDKRSDLEPLLHDQVFGGSFTGIRNELAHNTYGNVLAKWILTLDAVVVSALKDSYDVPPGTALYALLQQASRGLQQAADAIEGQLAQANRARDLTQLVSTRLRSALDKLLNTVELQVTANTSSVKPDTFIECTLQITNRSTLPLREVEVTVPRWQKEAKIGFLAEGQKLEIPLSGQTPSQGNQFDLTVLWKACRMDGKACDGSREISFRLVKEGLSHGEDPDFGASPYICGDPITPERGDVFVGRENLLAQIRRQIAATGNVVLLEGNRRAGKTSILKHLDGENAIPGWLGVYTSLQGAEGSKEGVGVPTDEVFRTFARDMAKAVHALGGETPLPNGSILQPGMKTLTVPKACREGISRETPFTDFQAYVETLLGALAKRNLGLLLLLDEFDKLQEGIDNGVTSPQVPENIRFLVQNYARFSAILTGSKRLRRLREEYWSALYGLGTRIGVTALDEKAAEELITRPVQRRLTYSKEAISRIVNLTAGQPFLLQCFCNRIYEQAVQLKTRSVSLDQVEQASLALIEDNEHFASLWDYAGGDERPELRRYLLALCHREGNGPTPLRLGVIQELLLADGIEVNDKDLVAALDHLRELELIKLGGNGVGACYRLSIPLMGIWIDQQRDVDATLATARNETEDHHD